MELELFLVLLALAFGLGAIRAKALLTAALWLAGASASLAFLLYLAGTAEIAVIELSVGAGLVTILFVFAITIAGDEAIGAPALLPRMVRWLALIAVSVSLAWAFWPIEQTPPLTGEPSFSKTLWELRGLDVMVQIGLIFAGVLGILGLLGEARRVTARMPETARSQPLAPVASQEGQA